MIDPKADRKWILMPEDDKLRHLYIWCDNMTKAIEELRAENRLLRERLSAAEAAAKGRAGNA